MKKTDIAKEWHIIFKASSYDLNMTVDTLAKIIGANS